MEQLGYNVLTKSAAMVGAASVGQIVDNEIASRSAKYFLKSKTDAVIALAVTALVDAVVISAYDVYLNPEVSMLATTFFLLPQASMSVFVENLLWGGQVAQGVTSNTVS